MRFREVLLFQTGTVQPFSCAQKKKKKKKELPVSVHMVNLYVNFSFPNYPLILN